MENDDIIIKFKKIERLIGYELPKEFKDIYLNKSDLKIRYNMLTLDQIITEICSAEELEEDQIDDVLIVEPKGTIIRKSYIAKRVPFITDDSGNYIGIDFKPGRKGCVGQIINYGRDEMTMYVFANSFCDFLDGIKNLEWGDLYLVDFLVNKQINFRKEIDQDKFPKKIILPKLKEKNIEKEIINEHTFDIIFNEDYLKQVIEIIKEMKLEISRNIKVIKSTVIFDDYRIKNKKDFLSRTMTGITNFWEKMEEYPQDEIKGFSINQRILIEEQTNSTSKKIGEEAIFIDFNKSNILVRYRKTIKNKQFKEAYNKILAIFS